MRNLFLLSACLTIFGCASTPPSALSINTTPGVKQTSPSECLQSCPELPKLQGSKLNDWLADTLDVVAKCFQLHADCKEKLQ